MKQRKFGRLVSALGLALLLPLLAIGCGGKKEEAANNAPGGTTNTAAGNAATGSSPAGEKGQTMQAPPAPPP